MDAIEVFADVTCPFTHAGLRRFVALRRELGRTAPLLSVRAWPLELVNGAASRGPDLAPKVQALRETVAPDLFAGFDPGAFPTTSLPALTAEAAARRAGPQVGEAFSLAVRAALFERGEDVADAEVLNRLRVAHRVPDPEPMDEDQVHADLDEGRRRGVVGSPQFFAPDGQRFFCPALEIGHEGGGIQVGFDFTGFGAFARAVFG